MDQKVKIGKNGRMIIPAEFRRALGFEDGDEAILHADEDGLRISTPAQAISRAQTLVRRYVPEGSDLSGELLADRRAEVESEVTRDSERS
ncbi:AbrB/MazE/SpoVT family DNA-binding domain-containing protein [Rubrobacter aplysinae]|uniref:AbrB/MazE/SpoVT family DNA-binding domain-containing protein n=1 Tax=Rubrobacter aplysinae TaxID=909625 RepID=UPI00064BE9FB